MKTIKLLVAASAALLFAAVGRGDDGSEKGDFEIVSVTPAYVQYCDITTGASDYGSCYRAEPGETVAITVTMTAEATCSWQLDGVEVKAEVSAADRSGNYVTTFAHTHEAGKSSFVCCVINGRYFYYWSFEDKPTAENPVASCVATPSSGTYLTLADGDKQALSVDVTVEPEGVELSYKWVDGSTGAVFADADSTRANYEYNYTASPSDKSIFCYVYKKGAEDKAPLCSANWVVYGVADITASPAITEMVRGTTIDTISFTVPGKSTSNWGIDKLAVTRASNTFTDVLAKSTLDAGATKVTLDDYGYGTQALPTGSYFVFDGCYHSEISVSGCGLQAYISSYYCYVNNGFSGTISYPDDDDGVYFVQDGTDSIFRWKGTLTAYGSSGDGGTTSDGSSGRDQESVTYKVNFAIILSQSGKIRFVYGDCGGATCNGQYVSGKGYSGSTMNGSNSTSGETVCATTADVIFNKALPNGLSFSATSTYGQLFGTPLESGTFALKVSCYVSGKGTISKTFTLTVVEPPPPEITITPSPLPNGKVGETYAGAAIGVGGVAAGNYNLTISRFSESRRANSFNATGGAKLTFSGDTASQTLAFKFPCGGSEFQTFTFFPYQAGCFSSTADGASLNIGLFETEFSFDENDSADGVYYSADGTTSATFRWRGNLTIYGNDGSSSTVKVNAAITLYKDGKVAYSFGDCNGAAYGGQNLYYAYGSDSAYYSNYSDDGGTGKGSGGETITSETEDLVLTPCFPAGLTVDYNGNLYGVPTQAGTYNFTVSAYVYTTYTQCSTNCTIVIEAADSEDPPEEEKKLEILTKTLAGGKVGEAYEDKIEVESSSELDAVEISGGALPDGLTLVAGGKEAMLSGRPMTAGKFTFEVKLTNKDGLEVSGVYEVEIEASGSSGGDDPSTPDDPSSEPELKAWSPEETSVTYPYDENAAHSFSVTMEPNSGLTYSWTLLEKKSDEPDSPLEDTYFITGASTSTCTIQHLFANSTFELSCAVGGKTVKTWTITIVDALVENHIWYVNQNTGSDSANGLSVDTARQNIYAISPVSGDEVRILYYDGPFNYANDGVRYIATNGYLSVTIGQYGAWLQNVELAADGSGYVFVTVDSTSVAMQTGPAIKIARIPYAGKLEDYDTASRGSDAGGVSGDGTLSEETNSGSGMFRINWGNGIAWDGEAYLVTNEQDEVWIMRDVGYPAPVCGGQGPLAEEASQDNPKVLTEGSSENFYVIVTNVVDGLHVYYRWEIDGVVKTDYSMAHLNYAPTHDKVDGEVHCLVCYSSNEYHTDAVTNAWFFTVQEAPLSCQTTLIRAPEGAFEYNLDTDVIGGKGNRTYALTNEVPEGIAISDAGVITGTMDEAVRGKKVYVVVTDEEEASILVALTLQPQMSGEEDFYLTSCTPDVEELDVYLGERPKFEIVGRSDSIAESDQNYLWFWNGAFKGDDPESYTPGEIEIDPNLEGETLTLSVYGSSTYGTTPHGTLLKQWRCTIRDRAFGFKTQTLPELTVGQSMAEAKAQIEFYLPYQKGLAKLEVLRGELPPGMLTYGTTIAGSPRQSGVYTNVLQATCSDGTVVAQEFVMTVNPSKTGNIPSHAWYVDATGEKHGENEDWCVSSVNEAITRGIMNGDTVFIYPGTYDNLDFFTKLESVSVHIMSGTVTLHVNAEGSLDVSGFILESGAKLAFAKGEYFSLDDDDAKAWGYPVRLAKVPSGAKVSDYAVAGFTHPEYGQTPKLDSENWLYLEKGLWQDTEENGYVWHLDLPDKVGRRDAVIGDYTFETELKITSSGVIPGTVTFDGAVSVGDVSLRDAGGGAVKVIVAATGVLTLTSSALDFAGNTMELKAGATINTPGYGFYNSALVLPAVGAGKVNLNLTASLGHNAETMLFRQYAGDADASKQFTLTQLPSDSETYRYVFWYGELNLVTYPESGEGDPGTLVWNTESDPADLGTFEQFANITHAFQVTGGSKYLGYSIVGDPFIASRGDACTFSSRYGERELLYRSLRRHGTAWDQFDDTVDIGFAFPFCGKYYSAVNVGADGIIYFGTTQQRGVRLLGNTRLSTMEGSDPTYCDVYIARGENKFTVRYGDFGSITLTPDGVVRMAFGADASLNSGREPTACSYFTDGNTERYRYTLPNTDFANQPDLIFTPSGVPVMSFDSEQQLVGTIDVPGNYAFGVKAMDADNGTLTRQFNFTVTATSTAPTVSCVTAPDVATDGFIHLAEGASANFAAVATAGAVAIWTVEYDGKTVTTNDTLVLTAPANRVIHRLARVILEVAGANGTWTGVYRKSWWVAFNKSIACTCDADIPTDLESSMLPGDELVLADGIYHKFLDFGQNPAPVTIRSASADANKVTIDGENAHRCFRQCMPTKVATGDSNVYTIIPALCRNAKLQNVTLLNGRAEPTLTYTWKVGIDNYGVAGGAAFGGTFEDCIIGTSTAVSTNWAKAYGGGVYGAKLTRCLIAQNAASIGGGASNCDLYNCTVADNLASEAAGGVDGECYAKDSIIRYNVRGSEENEYEPTYRPGRLVADEPTIVNSFITGDPLFCSDYTLASGSSAAGLGAYPTPHAGDCLVRIEIVGGGTVDPYDGGKVIVENGTSPTFTFAGLNGRKVSAVYVDGEKVADETDAYTFVELTANKRLKVVFTAATLAVPSDYPTISAAIAAAADGDTIEVAEGTYPELVDVSAITGVLTIQATGAAENTIIDGQGGRRCFEATPGATNVKLIGFTLKNGYVAGSTGYGAGAYGGYLEDCVITNCIALGGKGGGAYQSRLIRCGLYGNRAGDRSITDSWFTGAWGGGAYGGYLNDCRVSANRICANNKPKSDGAGVYDAEVRNSFVWGNYADIDQTSYERGNNAKAGKEGVLVYTKERVPTEANLAARLTPIAVNECVVYAKQADAIAAAQKQTVDIPTEVARKVSDLDSYANLFEIKTVAENGKYINKPELKEAVKEQIREQISSVLTEDDNGNVRTEFNVQKMEKTLTETTPGLYYALEFSTNLSSDSFVGERHLATGSGSVKLSATSIDTATSGFWRVNVYTTRDGE